MASQPDAEDRPALPQSAGTAKGRRMLTPSGLIACGSVSALIGWLLANRSEDDASLLLVGPPLATDLVRSEVHALYPREKAAVPVESDLAVCCPADAGPFAQPPAAAPLAAAVPVPDRAALPLPPLDEWVLSTPPAQLAPQAATDAAAVAVQAPRSPTPRGTNNAPIFD